jgi:hypothetical protein
MAEMSLMVEPRRQESGAFCVVDKIPPGRTKANHPAAVKADNVISLLEPETVKNYFQ